MSDKIIVRYSDFFDDDGGMAKVKDDFIKLGDVLKSEAERIKKEISSINLLDNGNMVSNYEKEVNKLVELSAKHKKAVGDLEKVIKDEQAEILRGIKLERERANAKRATNSQLASEFRAMRDLTNAITAENREKISAINLKRAERLERNATEKQIHKEIDAYGAMSRELREMFRETASVGVEMYKLKKAGQETSPEYQKLSKTFDDLQKEVIETDKALKDIDASLGRHQRKVGQYESGWNGLNNSINQITRELPAFTFSAQTGFMALSNNIPILADEIVNLKNKNKELIAQGKPVESTFKTILRATLSWQTALSLGVTLLTVYGGEIYNLVKELYSAKNALEDVEEAQRSYNNAVAEGGANARNRITEIQRLIAIANNPALDTAKRDEAVNQLREKSGNMLKHLTDEQIKHNKSLADYSKVMDAVIADEDYRQRNNEIESTRKRVAVLGEEIRARHDHIKAVKELENQINRYNKSAQIRNESDPKAYRKKVQDQIDELKRIEAIRIKNRDKDQDESLGIKKTSALISEKNQLEKENEERGKILLGYQEKAIGLYIKEEKTRKSVTRIIKEQTDAVDYLASKYEFEKLQLEGIIKMNEDIADSEKYTADERVTAMEKVMDDLKSLAVMERDEALRVLKDKHEKEKKETIIAGEDRQIMLKYTNKALLELDKQFYYDSQAIHEKYRQDIADADKKYDQESVLTKLQKDKAYWEKQREIMANTADDYEYFTVLISEANKKIDDIINRNDKLNLTDGLQISKYELESLKKQNEDLDKILNGRDFNKLNKREQEKVLKQVEVFQKERLRQDRNFEMQRKANRIAQIDEELKSTADGSIERLRLLKERADIEIQIEKNKQEVLNDLGKKNIDTQKKFMKELNDLIGLILDKMNEMALKRVEDAEKMLDKQNDAVEKQRDRANNGLINTLAFEQKQLAEREAELVKQQKRQERLEKIKAIWTSYSNYSNQDPSTAVQKALRDFALLEAITMSFGSGGVVEDRLPSNGIFRGQSHQGNRGGIPIMVEGKEGILSTKEMENLGKDNFYSLKHMAGMGKIDKDLFTKQRKSFDKAMMMPVPIANDNIAKELKGVQEAILNQPSTVIDQIKLVNDVLEVVIDEKRNNSSKKYTYRTNRRML